MKVLILGSDSSVGFDLCELMEAQSTIECIAVPKKNIDSAVKIITKMQPEFSINCYTAECAYIDAIDAKHVEWVEAVVAGVARIKGALIHVSSSQVFDGCKEGAYSELDEPNTTRDTGNQLFLIEQAIKETLAQALILRSGWIFGAKEGGFLDRLLGLVEKGCEIRLQADVDGAPTAAEDIARVINTIVWQLYYGADCWGVYHYCGSEVTTSMAFTDTLIALASQYGSLDLEGVCLVEVDDSAGKGVVMHPLISCEKILEAFGVKQRPWRSALISVIKKRYQHETDSAS